MSLRNVAKAAEKFTIDNSPSILTGIGVAGAVTAAYFTGRASFKAGEILRDEQKRLSEDCALGYDKCVEIEPRRKVELTWKLYIPAGITLLGAVAAIISANRIGTQRAAAVAAAWALSEKGFEEYREKMREKLGPKKEQAARDEIAQERLNKLEGQQLVIIGAGNQLCYEAFTGRVFYSDMESLRKAQNDINLMVVNNYYASLTDLYDLLGLPDTGISNDVGWNVDSELEMKFSAVLLEGKPVLSVDYKVSPIRGYNRLS